MEVIGNTIECGFKTDILSKMLEPTDSFKKNRPRTDSIHTDRITLNIGGTRFETKPSNFANIPGSRLHGLSILKKADITYDKKKDEYFFDRNAALFPFVLDLYRYPDSELHFPHCICGPIVQRELKFWNINDKIAPCCWKFYREFEDEKETLDTLEEAFTGHKCDDGLITENKSCWRAGQRYKERLWEFLENPASSLLAKIWAYFFVLLILTSSILLVLHTHSSFRIPNVPPNETASMFNSSNPKVQKLLFSKTHPTIKTVGDVISLIFIVELLLRFFICPSKLKFFKSFFNIIDIVSVLPAGILTTVNLISPTRVLRHHAFLAFSFPATAVLRSVRIFKIVRHNKGLQLIMLAIKASGNEIALLFILMGIGMLIFSTLIFHAQLKVDDQFDSVPAGLWWSIITMTTVGYGDMVPTTTTGRCVGMLCAITGMIITGLPIPIVASNFNHFYKCAKLKENMEKRSKNKKTRHCYSLYA